jgi:hypothetical protein
MGAVGFLVVMVLSVVAGYRIARQMPALRQRSGGVVQPFAMAAARRPVLWNANTRTWADVRNTDREFRVRQYLEGYQARGDRNPECDLLAQQFLTNWIAQNYGGAMDTNLPPLSVLSDRLASDPACQDPLLLTIAAINTIELHEANRRFTRAIKGFENSKHLAYPKFFATVMLAGKLIQDQAGRQPVLDAQALQYLKTALTDGSLQPGDQAKLAEILINDWGRDFFKRNAAAVCPLVQEQGGTFQWLALVLEGEFQINEAWRVRGDGYASSVSDAGWKGFAGHLGQARKNLTQAWQLRPDLPLAPCRMITVALGDGDFSDMRTWFDRTTVAQLDYAVAWNEMRWGLRPRWYGDYKSMLAFGVTALNTRRFDTDVPRMFFDSLSDLESEMGLPAGRHLYARADIWPDLQEMYEGYIAEPSLSEDSRAGWRSTYAVVASLAGKYDAAQKQFQALNWQPHPWNLTGWGRDLSLLPMEVAARTGPQSARVTAAEARRESGDAGGALQIYNSLSAAGNLISLELDPLTGSFVRDRLATLGVEQRLQAGGWVDFLPTDTNFTGWHIGFGKFKLLPDGGLEVQSDPNGHLAYSRVRLGTEFEVRGQFEVVRSSTTAFQAGLVMGVPQYENYNWYAFRMKRNNDEGDVASFSQHWTSRQIVQSVPLDAHVNSFDFRFQNGLVTATVDGHQVFTDAAPPKDSNVTTNEFLLGLGAFNDSNSSVIRYRQIQVRKL